MKTTNLNFRHLYYFWVVAKEGSVTRAAERLDVAVQTISAQLNLLEQRWENPCSRRKAAAWS